MKRTLILISMLLSVLAFSSPASALLMRTTVDSTYVVVDDVNNVQWADLNRFVNLTFSQVLTEINSMNSSGFAGVADWHLASLTEIDQLLAQIIYVGDARQFDHTYQTGSEVAYKGRYDRIDLADPPTHVQAYFVHSWFLPNDNTEVFKFNSGGNFLDDSGYDNLGAFVVSSATATAPVPEPATVLLLGTGLVGLVGFRKKFKK